MNKHCCRIVFNKPQGLPMAVTETATRPSQASGTASVLPGGRQPLFMAALKPLTFLFWGLLGMVLIPVAEAQIVADPSAPGNRRPTVLEAPNGVPLVNIQTPSAAGVSRNNYQQFDVNPQGAILNNSRQNIQTQLGGWVHGNPWLSKGEARIILNEVNSSNPSLLQGYMEIAGQRAQIVIANPAGVTCDGCGFINANRATVTTGTPLVTDGNLEAYRVQGGTVIVTGKGMDASGADYTDLIARSAEINAGLWARQLQVTAGVNDVSADAARITAKTGSGSAPVFAVDVSSLGGMYADKIVLVGSEAGVGVRNAGVIAAAAGEIAVTADGRLINQGAMISGDQALTIAARGVDNSGVLSTERNLTLTSQGGVDNSGLLHAGQELILDAGGTLSNRQGTLDAGRLDIEAQSLDNQDGTIRQSGAQALSLTAARIANTAGALIGGLTPSRAEAPSNSGIPAGDSDLDGYLPDSAASGAFDALPAASATPVPLADDRIVARDQLTNSGQIIASGKFTVSAAQNLANAGELTLDRLAVSGEALRNNGLISAAGVSVDAVTLDNSGGRLETAQLELGVHARDLLNIQGDIRHTGSAALGLALAGRLDNRDGQIASNGALALDASAVDNRAGKIESQGAVTFTSGEIDNTAGRISAAQALQFTADSLDNQDGQITGMGSGTFNLNGQLDNRGGLLATDGELSLDVGSLDNRQGGQILANDLLTVNTLTGALNNAGGLVSSQQALTVTARDELANAGGQIVAGTALRLTTGGDVDNTRGTLGALAGALELDAGGSLDNSGGRIEAATDLTLASRGFVNAQGVAFGQTLLIDARQQSVDNTDGILAAEKTLTIASGALDNTRGLFLSRGGLTLDTLADFNNAGQLTAAGNLSLATAGALTNDGLLQAGDTLSIRSPSLTNNVTGEMQGGALDIAVSGALVNRGLIDGGEARIDAGTLDNLGTGRIYGDHLALAADTLNNLPENTDAPVIAARERLDLGVGTLNNRDGALIFSAGDLAIGGGIDGNGHAVGQTASIDNASATIEALGDLTIDAAHLLNRKTAFATDRIQSDEAPSGMALLDYAPGLEFRWPIKETSPTTWRGYVRDRYLNVIARLLGGGPDEDMNDFIDIWSDLADSAVPAGDGLDAAVRARLVEAVNAMPMNEAAYSQAIWHTLIDTLGAVSPEMLQALVNSLSETGVSPQTYNQFCADWDDDCSYVENSVTTYATARDIVTVDTPAAVIRAGGGAAIAATTLENHYSTIQSGGDMALTGATLTNVGAELYLLTDTSTTTQLWHWVSRGKGATTAAASTQTLIGSAPALISAGGTLSGSFTGRIDNLTIRQNTAPVVGPIGTAPIGAAAVSVTPGARLVQVIAADNADGPAALIVTAELALTLPANRLYHTQPGSASAYLIETDPVFASYRKWLGSDYLL
ncbi:MAG: filamentous hemagglutinin N-terminal domain-containing protein, partial [Candidatus Accumulibacter sp.]|nr:filamentous hemagglutinin N-terminal domain-containing protein [Accumulibacter sp.]